jgi:hypothetical protein
MAKKSDDKPASGAAKFPVKWIVLGVLALAFMLLFRRELGGLLERTSDLKITSEGVVIKAEVKTVETPLGKTEVSAVPVARTPQTVTGVHDTTYVDMERGFQISWPNNRDWTADQNVGKQLLRQMGAPATVDIPIAILSNTLADNFRPNVNVVVEKVGQTTIQNYVALNKQNLVGQGWEVLSSSVDAETRGGVIVLISDMSGTKLYQFQRYAVNNGNAYVITASQIPQSNLNQGLKQDLADIINSFRIIQ